MADSVQPVAKNEATKVNGELAFVSHSGSVTVCVVRATSLETQRFVQLDRAV